MSEQEKRVFGPCIVQTDTAGVTHVAVFDPRYTAPIETYSIPDNTKPIEVRDDENR